MNKKKIGIIVAVLLIVVIGILSITGMKKSNPVASFRIDGEFKEGNTVDLVLEVKNVDRLYGGQMDFTYNPEYIKINTITQGDFFKTVKSSPFDANSTEKDGQVAQYLYTYTGDEYGLKGSGDLVKVNMTILKAGKLDINEGNMAVTLIKREKAQNPDYMTFTQNTLSVGEGDTIPAPTTVVPTN